MNRGKASRAMEHLDERLIMSAMDDSDLTGGEIRMNTSKGERKMKKAGWKKWVAAAAAFAVILSTVLIAGNMLMGTSAATVALDVNPSIEIETGRNEKVKEVRALNSEAEIVLEGLAIEGLEIDDAIDYIILSMVEHGYISSEQNSVLLSVDADKGRYAGRLRDKLAGEINEALAGKNIVGSVLSQIFDREGEGSGNTSVNISAAKSALISKIIAAGLLDANGVPYSYETLAQLKVNDLKLILESKGIIIEGVGASGTASAGSYISVDRALEIALAKAGIAQADVSGTECEMDYDDDHRAMVYEIEFIYGENEYEYEILALDGKILEEAIGPADEHESIAAPENAISRDAALAVAYADAAIDAASVRRPKIELDIQGTVYVYEVEFKVGASEYEYKINAVTGAILEREIEPID